MKTSNPVCHSRKWKSEVIWIDESAKRTWFLAEMGDKL